MTGKGSGKRGRPLGFRLSEASKRAISQAKVGQQHKPETKDKISKSLVMYFKQKNPISEELTNRYCRTLGTDDICDWIYDIGEDLDATPDIMTEKAVNNKSKMEIPCGPNIEYFSHEMTPELIILFVDYCIKNNLDIEDVLEEVFK